MLVSVFIKEIFNSDFIRNFEFSPIGNSDILSYFKNNRMRILNNDVI